MPHPFDMWGAGEVTQFCESETIKTPMTKWPFYEYSEPASPPWEANMLVPFSFLLLETKEALLVNGAWQLLAALPFACSKFLIYIFFCIHPHAK